MSEIEPSWQRLGRTGYSGWMWSGTVPASNLLGGDFWSMAVRAACSAEGGFIDAAQCYDSGIMTAGPLQATARYGTLAALLSAMPQALIYEYCQGPMRMVGLTIPRDPPVFMKGPDRITDETGLRAIFLGGSDGKEWTLDQQHFGRLWVVSLARMFQDPRSWWHVSNVSIQTLKQYLTEESKRLLGFAIGSSVPLDEHSRKATACFLSFAINNPKGAATMLRLCGQQPSYERILELASRTGAWPSTFQTRVNRTRAAIEREDWR